MRIKFIRAEYPYEVGNEFDWDDGIAQLYIARGVAIEVKKEPPPTLTPDPEFAAKALKGPARDKMMRSGDVETK